MLIKLFYSNLNEKVKLKYNKFFNKVNYKNCKII